MSANIDSIDCDFVIDVRHQNDMERGETWVRDGIDGTGAKKSGKGPGAFSFRLIKFEVTLADLHTWQASIEALKYTKLVDAEDSDGDTYTDLLIEDVSPLVKDEIIDGGTRKKTGELIISGSQT